MESALVIETEVAAAAQVSRTPVREALNRLSSEGLVERTQHKGVVVPRVRSEEIDWLFQSRALIEVDAVRHATADPEEVASAMSHLLELQQAAATDPISFIDLDYQFHATAVVAAGNPYNLSFYRSLRDRQLRVGQSAVRGPNRMPDVLKEHAAILRAISEGDPEGAEAAVRLHIERTSALVKKSFRPPLVPVV